MAVVQISRVQVRRGRKNSGTGIPQLASGEMGWSIDTQELYIGNGSIAEGAPYVGNTKILTEHDNILDLALQYEYQRTPVQTGATEGTPVKRSFQQRLDDSVSIRAFGAVGDGVYTKSTDSYTFTTDDTLALQRAIDELYLNPANEDSASSRVVLNFDAGIFVISQSLKVPPYAVLQGAGKDKTIIVQTGDFPVFQTVGSTTTGVSGYTTLTAMTVQNQPRFVEVSGMTLRTTTSAAPAMILESTVNSSFSNVKFQSSWNSGDALTELDSCVQFKSTSTPVTCKDNTFDSCDFVSASYALSSGYDIVANTFHNCLFENLGEGVYFGAGVNINIDGRAVGPCQNKFIGNRFIDIDRRGIAILNGSGNLSQGNSYVRVGNDGGNSSTAAYPVVYFGQGGNASDDDYFERSVESTLKAGFTTVPYISEVGGVARSNHKFNTQVALTANAINSTLMRLPATASSRVQVHYLYQSSSNAIVRQGTLYVTIDKFNNTVKLTDEYDVTGTLAKLDALSFTATLEDLGQATGEALNNKETVFIKYTNGTAGENGYVNYWYEILS